MPLFQYFGWVGSFLLAVLLAGNWCFSAPIARAPRDVLLNEKMKIRIHTDHRWPVRVVFDTTRSGLAAEAIVDSGMNIGAGQTLAPAERQPFDAFTQMAALPVRYCFRPPCSAGQVADHERR
jgi:hypothetical protein